jgi:hypothetical protein
LKKKKEKRKERGEIKLRDGSTEIHGALDIARHLDAANITFLCRCS